MKRLAFLLFAMSAVPCGFAQVDLQEIAKLTKDRSTAYYYDTLVKEFQSHPYDFEMSKGISLYYGKLFTEDYEPYTFSPELTNFEDFFRQGNYQRAIVLGQRIMEKDPVDFGLLLKLLRCYMEQKDEDLANFTRLQVNVLFKAIQHSGDGETPETAIKVIQIADEYAIMALMDVQGISRRSEMKGNSIMDIWKVRPAKKGGKKAMYFELMLKPAPRDKG